MPLLPTILAECTPTALVALLRHSRNASTDFRLKTTGLDGGKLNPFDLASEPIFPPYLMTHPPSDLRVKGDVMEFFRPTTLKGT